MLSEHQAPHRRWAKGTDGPGHRNGVLTDGDETAQGENTFVHGPRAPGPRCLWRSQAPDPHLLSSPRGEQGLCVVTSHNALFRAEKYAAFWDNFYKCQELIKHPL